MNAATPTHQLKMSGAGLLKERSGVCRPGGANCSARLDQEGAILFIQTLSDPQVSSQAPPVPRVHDARASLVEPPTYTSSERR